MTMPCQPIRAVVTAASMLLAQHGAAAQADDPAAAGQLALTARHDRLTAGLGEWRDLSLRGSAQLGNHLVQAELASQRHFKTLGHFAGVSDTYTFSPDWYGSLAVGAGNGAFFLPRYRVDAFVYKKWFAQRHLVTYAGAGRYRAPDGHADRSTTLGAIYYFGIPLVLEGGIRRNTSDPGAVRSRQTYLAASYGRHGSHLLAARHRWGTEGYLPIAPGSNLVGYASRETSVSWRQWFGRRTGVDVELHRYDNSLYRRQGAALTLFHDF